MSVMDVGFREESGTLEVTSGPRKFYCVRSSTAVDAKLRVDDKKVWRCVARGPQDRFTERALGFVLYLYTSSRPRTRRDGLSSNLHAVPFVKSNTLPSFLLAGLHFIHLCCAYCIMFFVL